MPAVDVARHALGSLDVGRGTDPEVMCIDICEPVCEPVERDHLPRGSDFVPADLIPVQGAAW